MLEQIVRRTTNPYRLVRRAQLVLAAARGMTNSEISQHWGLERGQVRLWRQRWVDANASEKSPVETLQPGQHFLDTLGALQIGRQQQGMELDATAAPVSDFGHLYLNRSYSGDNILIAPKITRDCQSS